MCFCEQVIDKKKIKMRLSSKKKKPPESCVEKRDLTPASEVSTQDNVSSLNSAELNQLQELLRQKRCQLEQHDEASTTVTVTGDSELQQTDAVLAGVYYTNV